jgi:hypothetical protein
MAFHHVFHFSHMKIEKQQQIEKHMEAGSMRRGPIK